MDKTRLTTTDSEYPDLYRKYITDKQPREITHQHVVWMPVKDNDQLVFVKVRDATTFDSLYSDTTFRL